MNFDNLKSNIKSKKTIAFISLLIFLIISYILVGYIESKAAFSNENKLAKTLDNMEICIGGEAVGIKILATGVLVMSADEQPKLSVGDIILEINKVAIDSNAELVSEVQKSNGQNINLKIDRNGEIKNISVTANYSNLSNMYELGIWVKDSSAGVGTVSFYDKNNMCFACLGHGITETTNNIIIPINSGGIVKTRITEIKKGESKNPGDIKGILYTNVLGQIIKNTAYGIYGILEEDMCTIKEEIKVASKLDIKEGKAKIYCTLENNKVEEFEINIERILYNSSGNKNMVIKITDEKLLEKTGGIVQGMSGSPIVQDNKLVGAITHVFYNDPTQGYAVFAENMINDMASINK